MADNRTAESWLIKASKSSQADRALGYIQAAHMTNIPVGAFGGLRELSVLYLSSNQLTNIPVGAFNGLGGPLHKPSCMACQPRALWRA